MFIIHKYRDWETVIGITDSQTVASMALQKGHIVTSCVPYFESTQDFIQFLDVHTELAEPIHSH